MFDTIKKKKNGNHETTWKITKGVKLVFKQRRTYNGGKSIKSLCKMVIYGPDAEAWNA